MISISVGLLGGLETAAASVGKKDADGPAFADTFQEAAASGRTKAAAGGTQRGVKIERGTGQARKAGRSAQSDGGVKQGELVSAKDVSGVKGGVVGKKIVDVAEVVEEQVGDGQNLQDLMARAGVTGASARAGKGQVMGAAKDGSGSSLKEGLVEVAGLAEETPVVSGDEGRVLQSGAQRTVEIAKDGVGQRLGSSVVAQRQATATFGDGEEKAIGGSIRPDLRGVVDVADAELPVATVQGLGFVTVAVPPAAGGNESEPIAEGLTKMVDEGGVRGMGVEASSVASAPASAGATALRGGGLALPKTILQTRQIPDGDAVVESFSGVEQVAGGVKSEPAVGQKPVVEVAGASPFSGQGSAKIVSAIPMTGVQGSGVVEVAAGGKSGLVSLVTTPTEIEDAAEVAGEMAGRVDGGGHAGPMSTQPLPVAVDKREVVASVAEPVIVADVPADKIADGLLRVAAADVSGEGALKGAVAEVVAQPVAAYRAESFQEGSKTTVKSVVRHGETERAKETDASESDGGGKIQLEASATGVVAPVVGAGSVVPVASASAAAPPVGGFEVTADDGGRGVAAPVGPVGRATSGLISGLAALAGNDSVAGVQAAKSTTLAGSVTATVAQPVEGLKATKNSAGQALEVSADPVLPTAVAAEAGQGLAARGEGSAPVEANGAVAAEPSEVVAGAIAPVKAGQERKAVGGAASVGVRERKGAALESKTANVAASAGAEDAGRTVAVASSSDAAVGSAKPSAADHRAQGSEGGQVSAAPVGIVDGAAVQAHVASTMPVNAAVAASAAANSASSVGAAGGAHAASGTASAGDSLVSPMAHTTLQATPTVLEVGVPGGTHGWLKIRAEIGEGGAVTASMSASSHAGQDALRRDLPAMNAFLESEHVPVSLQVVHGTGSSWADKDGAMTQGGTGLGAGPGQSSGQDGQGPGRGEGGAGMLGNAGGRQQGGNASSQGGVISEAGGRSEVAGRSVVEGDAVWSSAPGYGSGVRANGGSWLNVVA